ncbi:MAG: hypothetical protein P1U62_12655 [Alteraurantiacibacter sp. bin_em_oilr2.035]|nr:hypothetical protein [Alteraurantiacibacter sp. bin_em_oilr2.035]
MIKRLKSISPLFVGVVLLPTILAAVYFGVFAEDVYVSESRIIVRSPSKPNASPLGSVIGSSALTGATEESDAVSEFLESRDALTQINEDGYVRAAYGTPDIFFLDRFGGLGNDSFEKLYEYFGDKVGIEEGSSILVLRLRVEAFEPGEAQEINERLLQASETLVNGLSERARTDALRFSEHEVASAREDARSASLALANFRDQEGVVDPEIQASIGLQMVAQLQDELIAARTRLQQMRTYTPQASQIPFLQTQVRELEQEIAEQTASISGGRGSLSSNTARYQELLLASELADQQLGIVLATAQEAEADARRKQAYVDRISDPSLPDYATYPRRLRSIIAAFVLGLLTWGILSMLITGIKEHRD